MVLRSGDLPRSWCWNVESWRLSPVRSVKFRICQWICHRLNAYAPELNLIGDNSSPACLVTLKFVLYELQGCLSFWLTIWNGAYFFAFLIVTCVPNLCHISRRFLCLPHWYWLLWFVQAQKMMLLSHEPSRASGGVSKPATDCSRLFDILPVLPPESKCGQCAEWGQSHQQHRLTLTSLNLCASCDLNWSKYI